MSAETRTRAPGPTGPPVRADRSPGGANGAVPAVRRVTSDAREPGRPGARDLGRRAGRAPTVTVGAGRRGAERARKGAEKVPGDQAIGSGSIFQTSRA